MTASAPHPLALPEQLTPAQEAVIEALEQGSSVVVEAPARSGKTTLALAAAAHFTTPSGPEDQPVILVPTRRRRVLVEDSLWRLSLRRPYPVLTPAALAFAILQTWRGERADPLAPLTLLTGADEDALLADILRTVPGAPLPAEALETEVVRVQVRNLCARCGDFGITPEQLRAWGREGGIGEWAWAADVLAAYLAPRESVDASRSVDLARSVLQRWHLDAGDLGVGAPCPSFPLVIVDDMQDMTGATGRLLADLHAQGSQLLVLSSRDVAVDVHRGGLPTGASDLVAQLGSTARVQQVRWTPDDAATRPEADVDVRVYASAFDEGAGIAATLQRRHLFDGIAYSDMAVIVRSGAMIDPLARALGARGVATEVPARRQAPAAQPLTRALLDLVVFGPDLGAEAPADPADAERIHTAARDVLGSVLVGLTDLDIFRLARYVRGSEANANTPISAAGVGDLLRFLASPAQASVLAERAGQADHLLLAPARRVHAAATLLECARACRDRQPLEGLWELWQHTGVAPEWTQQALSGSTSAHELLDEAVVLFREADFWTQRHLGGTLAQFATYLSELRVPLDTVAVEAQRVAGVSLLTPSQAAGRSFDTVVIAGLNDGVWPNLTLRDSLVRTDFLIDCATGRADPAKPNPTGMRLAREATARDERRMFDLARSRARARLVLTGVDDPDHTPSRYLIAQWAATPAGRASQARGQTGPSLSQPEPPLSARALAGQLRRELIASQRLIDALTLLGAAGESAALPETWTGLAGGESASAQWATSHTPIYPPGSALRLSPSTIASLNTCPLRWMLTSQGATTPSDSPRNAGLIIHQLAQEFPDGGTLADLQARAEELWEQQGGGAATYSMAKAKADLDGKVAALHTFLSTRSARAEVEKPVSAHLSGDDATRISGVIDRLEHGDDGPYVVDFKSGSPIPSKVATQVDPQLLAYQKVLQLRGDDPAGAALVYLTKDGKPVARVQKSLSQALPAQAIPEGAPAEVAAAALEPGGVGAWADHLMTSAATAARQATVVAQRNPGCDRCPVQTSCPLTDRGERTLS